VLTATSKGNRDADIHTARTRQRGGREGADTVRHLKGQSPTQLTGVGDESTL